MNAGRSLQSLAAELERQVATRRDYIAPQGKVTAVVVDAVANAAAASGADFEQLMAKSVRLDGFNGEPMELTPYAHGQLSDHLGIPKKYYDRMAVETPQLLADSINTWFRQDADNKRMIRTLDNKVRAVLSPKFRPLDNFDLASAVLPTLIEKQVQIVSSELTQTRMYIKGILPSLSDELPDGLAYGGHNRIGTDRGHLVAAITISNSDIGAGTLRVEPSVFTTWCTNLAIMMQAAMKKYHTGRANQADETWEVFADETRKADDQAFWLKVRDICGAAFNEANFRAAVAQMRDAGKAPIKSDDLNAVVVAVVEQFALPVSTQSGILKALASGGDFTAWGLSSAVTRVAGEVSDYELSTSMERAGGAIITLQGNDWKRISEAATA